MINRAIALVFLLSSFSQSSFAQSSTSTTTVSSGELVISEVTDGFTGVYSYLELMNLTNTTLDVSDCKLVSTSGGTSGGSVLDLGEDGSGQVTIPPNGFLVIARDVTETDFEVVYGALPVNSNYYNAEGVTGSSFITESLRWFLKCGGTLNTNDGTTIDEMPTTKTLKRAFQFPKGNWNYTDVVGAVSDPGEIRPYEDPSLVADLVYDGSSWIGGAPGTGTGGDKAVVANGFETFSSDVALDSLIIYSGALLQVNTNSTLTVNKDLVNEGTLRIRGGSSLLQTQSTDNNTGSGTYQVQRSTGVLVDNTRFQYWSSPISNGTMGDVFFNSNNVDFYFFDETLEPQNWSSQSSGATMTPGRGYITTGDTLGGLNFTELRSFSGTVNNGDIDLTTSGVETGEYILVGNPYPSAISSAAFIADNPGINGTCWFWNHSTPESGGINDSQDYATWNGTGSTGGNTAEAPDDYIQSAQGFFVESISSNPIISFNNAQRVAGNNTQFFKSDSETRKRVWLNITNDSNDFNQVLIGFLPEATEGIDRLYDGEKFKAHPRLAFYSEIENSPFSIQGLPWVNADEESIVALGVDAWITGEHVIELDSLHNWSPDYTLILEDRWLNIKTNLKETPTYSFQVDSTGAIQQRFFLHVKHVPSQNGDVTGTEELVENNIVIYNTQHELVIASDLSVVREVTVFDMSGREVHHQSTSVNTIQIPWISKGIFIVNVKTADGKVMKTKVKF